LMKLWLPPWSLLNCPDFNRALPRNTLHFRHRYRFFLRCPHLPRRQLRLTHPQPSCKRSLLLLHLHLPPHRPRPVLWILPLQRDLKHRSRPTSSSNDDRLRRICSSMRTNVLLRSHSHYKPPIRRTLRRQHTSSMNLRRILSRQRNTNPILRLPLPLSIRNRSGYNASPPIPTRNRLKQPPRLKLRLRQNLLPPLLLLQRPLRVCSSINRPDLPCSLLA